MRLLELFQNITYANPLPADADVSIVTDDSRRVVPGAVFVCIEGKRFDGHSKAAQAIEAGAVCVVAQKPCGTASEVIVENTRAAYARLCAAFHGDPADKLTLVGITGTNGKTTTAFLLKELFDACGYTTGLVGTLVNMVGQAEFPAVLTTPDPWDLQALFAQMVDAGCTHCFMEVSSQALDQRRVENLRFNVGIFTNLTQDHLDYHETFENYLNAKKKLFAQSDIAIINMDDPAGPRMSENAITYAIHNPADYIAKDIQLNAGGVEYKLNGQPIAFHVPGAFSVYNSMAAAVTALQLGLRMEQIVAGLARSGGVTGRMEVVPTNTDYTVIIDYAHSPDGLENVTRALKATTKGRLITVFGCGGDRDRTKRPIMGAIAAEGSDVVVVTSDNPRSEDPDAIIAEILAGITDKSKVLVEPDRRQAIALALQEALPGDTVLLAGKGQETYQILATGKIHMDEREIVKQLTIDN